MAHVFHITCYIWRMHFTWHIACVLHVPHSIYIWYHILHIRISYHILRVNCISHIAYVLHITYYVYVYIPYHISHITYHTYSVNRYTLRGITIVLYTRGHLRGDAPYNRSHPWWKLYVTAHILSSLFYNRWHPWGRDLAVYHKRSSCISPPTPFPNLVIGHIEQFPEVGNGFTDIFPQRCQRL